MTVEDKDRLLKQLFKRADEYSKQNNIMNEYGDGFYDGIAWAVKKLFKMGMLKEKVYLDRDGNEIRHGSKLELDGKLYEVLVDIRGEWFVMEDDGENLYNRCEIDKFYYEKSKVVN